MSDNSSSSKPTQILPSKREECPYQECYCEENIYQLLTLIKSNHPNELGTSHVAFVSNKKRMVPMWHQKVATTNPNNEDNMAIWDYHVILIHATPTSTLVYDLDSTLPFPTHFHRYVNETFRTDGILGEEYWRWFRVVGGEKYLALFSSDRRHMKKDGGGGGWLKEEPKWGVIWKGAHNLDSFIDMTSSNEYGDVYNLMGFVERFYNRKRSDN